MSHVRMSKKSVVGMIRRKNSSSNTSGKTIHHNNPLFKSPSFQNQNISPLKRKTQNFPAPSSPIKKKTFRAPGSPLPSPSYVQAGSPMRQPRSPLSPKNMNITVEVTTKQNPDTPRPKPVVFHQNLNDVLRTGRPKKIPGSPLRRKRPVSCYSPSRSRKNKTVMATSLRQKKLKIEIPSHLPPPPKIPQNSAPLPNDIKPPSMLSNDSIPSKVKRSVSEKSSTERNAINIVESSKTTEELVEKIRKKATIQISLAVYQAIQLFCCGAHRSPKILHCLLQFNPVQMIQHIMSFLVPSRCINDRRNALDTLSSLLLLVPPSHLQKNQNIAAETLRNSYLPMLQETLKEEDFVIHSYATGILASLNVNISEYFGCNHQEHTTDAHPHKLPSIIQMLHERNAESKEKALTTIICMGPTAAPVVDDLGEFLMNEKNSQLRILACRALYEIGSPYALQVAHLIQEVVRKDKDENVKTQAQALLDYLSKCTFAQGNNENSSKMENQNIFTIDEDKVKLAITESQSTSKGSPVTLGDLKQYFLQVNPAINKENPNWKVQLRDSLHHLVAKGSVSKSPATYSL